MMPLIMKPISGLRIGDRKILECKVLEGDVGKYIGHELRYSDGMKDIVITLDGLSTAWHASGNLDITFSGELDPSENFR